MSLALDLLNQMRSRVGAPPIRIPKPQPKPQPRPPVIHVSPLERILITSGSPGAASIGASMYLQRGGKAPPKSSKTETPPFVPPVFGGVTTPQEAPPKMPLRPQAPQLPPGTILVRKSDVEALQEAAAKQQEVMMVPYPYIPRLPRRYGVSRATGQVGRRIGRGESFEHMLASRKFAVRRVGGLF